MTTQKIAWQPTPKQEEFLSAPEDVVLYGGAAGGGKSDGLEIDALGLQQGAIAEPDYQAVIFRRSYPELRDLIERSHALYPAVDPGAKYNKQDKVWRFSSGALIEFNFLKREADRHQYQGRAFPYVGFDELTQYPTGVVFRYMLSRNRTTNPRIKPYMRATCNPGGVGHEWVRQEWRIPDEGSATRFRVELKDPETGKILIKRFRFIPARLSDNPYLGDDYRANLLMQSEMDIRALYYGRWDVVEIPGQIYKDELQQAYLDGRVCQIPIEPGIPVNTFWDLGRDDATAIWFHQRVGLQNRFIDYHEDNMVGLSDYIKLLQSKNYLYGQHYLPHDVEHTTLGIDTRSRREMLEQGGVRPIITVPRIDNLADGIEITRRAFASSWFDKTRCVDGLAALKGYSRKYNEKQQVWSSMPVHNWASNGADAFRMFGQGFRNLEKRSQRRSESDGNWKVN